MPATPSACSVTGPNERAMTLTRMERILSLALLGALALAPTVGSDLHESCKPAQIAFNVPQAWVVDNEQALFVQGFIVPPEPLYALVAAPSPTPSHLVFNPSSVPWLFVTVETDDNMLPPSQLYELTPNYLKQLAVDAGNSVTAVKTLFPHHSVHEGGLSGSGAALTVVSPTSSTSFDELAYGTGDKLWLVIVGCSASCYNHYYTLITHIMNSVRVGTAA